MSKTSDLRDEIAITVLGALLSNDVIARSGIKHGEKTDDMLAWMPETAYKFADAMLRARELKL